MTGSGQRSFHPVTSFNLGRSATRGVVAHGPRASRRARPRVSCAAMLQLTALLLVAQIQLPPPRGYVNDFAGVLDSASLAHMEAVITEVRAKTRGEIAVVTLSDIADRPAADVALEIGRRWGVGAKGEAGDPAKNLGVVVLLVPLKNHRAGTGQIFIATARPPAGHRRELPVPQVQRELPRATRSARGDGEPHRRGAAGLQRSREPLQRLHPAFPAGPDGEGLGEGGAPPLLRAGDAGGGPGAEGGLLEVTCPRAATCTMRPDSRRGLSVSR